MAINRLDQNEWEVLVDSWNADAKEQMKQLKKEMEKLGENDWK